MSTKISITELNRYQPLDSLNPDNLKEISEKLVVHDVTKGRKIFTQGDKQDDHVYLHKGTVDLMEGKKVAKSIEAGSDEAKVALAHMIPRNFTAVAKTDVTVFNVNSDLLDMMLTWTQTGSFQVHELIGQPASDDWMSRILSTEAFRRIPPANIQAIFTSLEDVPVKVGDVVIKQGDPGDYFYIIKSGRCMVTRTMPEQEKEIKLAELKAGDSFGEEALISDDERNATIVMLSDGVMSRLSKEQFLELLNEPMLDRVDYETIKNKVDEGEAEWLDVRLPAEYENAHIKGCTHIPLIFMRMKADTLDKNKHYIVYCDTERRSSSASFLLNERGFNTSVLRDGIKDIPQEDMEGSAVAAQAIAQT